jgi:hypothetical protein
MNKILRLICIAILGLSSLANATASGLTLAQYREWNRDPIKKEMLSLWLEIINQRKEP